VKIKTNKKQKRKIKEKENKSKPYPLFTILTQVWNSMEIIRNHVVSNRVIRHGKKPGSEKK